MLIITILVAVWIIRILLNVLSYIQLWYIKEYRTDRMAIHLRTRQGRRLFFIQFKRPPISPKTVFVFICTIITMVIIVFYVPVFILIKTAVLDLLTFPIVTLYVLVTKIPTFVFHQIKIRKAVLLLSRHKPMRVIGITGSYGKTSTKEIIDTILSQKYKTIKTLASKNSPIAIAEVLLTKLLPDHQVFIVEMGAYKPGEIHTMCDMVHPQIAVLTAINAQHQDLFGTIEMTMRAKYELVQGLIPGGVVIANADNTYIKTMSKRAENDGKTVYLYSAVHPGVYMYADNIRTTLHGLSFSVHVGNDKGDVRVPLLGAHHVSNLLAGMAAALQCNMTFAQVIKAVKKVRPFTKTMFPVKGIKGAVFIDDTFNNNPEAAKAALDYMSTQAGRKIFIFQPMIELGQYAPESHREVGRMAARICHEIILTNDNYNDSFMEGVQSAHNNVNVRVLSGHQGAVYLYKRIQKGDTVLFKGKESARILEYILRMEHQT